MQERRNLQEMKINLVRFSNFKNGSTKIWNFTNSKFFYTKHLFSLYYVEFWPLEKIRKNCKKAAQRSPCMKKIFFY